jgi:hypothetical protein
MHVSDKIKGLLLQRINPLRIKINDPQKSGYHSNLTDLTQVSQYLSTTLALSSTSKHAFCVATLPQPKQSFNSSSFRSFEMGSIDRSVFNHFILETIRVLIVLYFGRE